MTTTTPLFTSPSLFMQRALALATQARGHCHPNPMVGCVLVQQGRIVGEGWHQRAGTAHAEVQALQQAGAAARGATAYVTLEPCNHWGRTPPCTLALLEKGVGRMNIAMADVNPLAHGGANRLCQAGVSVSLGDGAAEAEVLNERWLTFIQVQRPFVHLKVAMSLDGKAATSIGENQWITGPDARQVGHLWRDSHEAIVVGAQTLRTDNPSLTCRLEAEQMSSPVPVRQPLRVVVAGRRSLPAGARIFHDGTAPVLVIAPCSSYRLHKATLAAAGPHVEVVDAVDSRGYPDPQAVLERLYARDVVGVLLEGGPILAAAFLDAGLVDRISAFIAPKLLGRQGVPAFRQKDATLLRDALSLGGVERLPVGEDTLLTGRVCLAGRTGTDR